MSSFQDNYILKKRAKKIIKQATQKITGPSKNVN